MRLSVVTPTIGRTSLRDTLASIAGQLLPGDEHIVIGDGRQPAAAAMCREFGAAYHDGPFLHDYGATQRDYGIDLAAGDYLLFCDDDDTFTPGALEAVRAAIGEHPGLPLVFRMDTLHSGVLWKDQAVRNGNVGTPMIVTPHFDDLPRWCDGGGAYNSDLVFIQAVTDAHGAAWREEVICIVGKRV